MKLAGPFHQAGFPQITPKQIGYGAIFVAAIALSSYTLVADFLPKPTSIAEETIVAAAEETPAPVVTQP